MNRLFLLSLILFGLAACDSSSPRTRSDMDPSIRSLIDEVNQMKEDINRGDLLEASAQRDRNGIREVLSGIKLSLLRIAEDPNDDKAYELLKIYLQELEKFQLLKEDRPKIEAFANKVYTVVDGYARGKGVKLTHFEWRLFSTRFSDGLEPFMTFSSLAGWSTAWGLDESYVYIGGNDIKAWLISPSFDLKEVRNPSFEIDHTVLVNKNSSENLYDRSKILREAFKVMVSTNYIEGMDPNLPMFNWTPVDISPFPDSDDFLTVTSPRVDLSAFKGKRVSIALLYDYNIKDLGRHYPRWQVSRFSLLGGGQLPSFAGSLMAFQFSDKELLPFQQIALGSKEGSALWAPTRFASTNYAKIGSNRQSIHTWLLSPIYRIRDQKYLTLTIEETVKNPKWENFRIGISTNYRGGNPAESQWDYIPHSGDAKPESFKDLQVGPLDLSKYANKDIVIGFEFIDPSSTNAVIWEIKSLQIFGLGADIDVYAYPITYNPDSGREPGNHVESLYKHSFKSIEPFQQYALAYTGPIGSWEQFSLGSSKHYARIQSVGEKVQTWLLSPVFKIKDQKSLTLTISETVRNPEWENFKVKISKDYKGGDPSLATWIEIDHKSSGQVPAESWFDQVTAGIDLSEFANSNVVVGFEYINEASPRKSVVWEVESVEIFGEGDKIIIEDLNKGAR